MRLRRPTHSANLKSKDSLVTKDPEPVHPFDAPGERRA